MEAHSFPKYPHQHSAKVMGEGGSLEQAFEHAVAGLVDPEGHYSYVAFRHFEVVKISGTLAANGSKAVQITIEAFGSHRA